MNIPIALDLHNSDRMMKKKKKKKERKIDRFRTRFATLLLSQLINGFCWMLVEAFNARTQPY